MRYELCEKIVQKGESKIYNDWQGKASITQDQFLEAIKWLSEDPANKTDGIPLEREIGLAPGRIKKLKRVYSDTIERVVAFYEVETGMLWNGEIFRIPANEIKNGEFYAEEDGCIPLNYKISLSCKDRI